MGGQTAAAAVAGEVGPAAACQASGVRRCTVLWVACVLQGWQTLDLCPPGEVEQHVPHRQRATQAGLHPPACQHIWGGGWAHSGSLTQGCRTRGPRSMAG